MTFDEFTDRCAGRPFIISDCNPQNRSYKFKCGDDEIAAQLLPMNSVNESVNNWSVSLNGENVEFKHPYELTSMDFALTQIMYENLQYIVNDFRRKVSSENQ